jgi:hypothetical protein
MEQVRIAPRGLGRYNPTIPLLKGELKSMNKCLCIVVLGLLAAAGGCGVYSYGDENVVPVSAMPPRSTWTVAASSGLSNPGNALDNNRITVASATEEGGSITIDLGEVSLFNLVIVDHGNRQNACAGRVAVYTSLDGENFTHRFTGPGTRYVSYYSLVAPSLTRYLRLTVVREGRHPLSIAEVYLR